MIDRILEKGLNREDLSKEELVELFKINNKNDFNNLMHTASKIRNEERKKIKLTSTIHITNSCSIRPKCKYCGFASKTSEDGYYNSFYKSDDEILKIALSVEKSGIPRISCSGAHGYGGTQAVKASDIVKKNTNLELLINVGFDLNQEAIDKLVSNQTDTVCCNLETTNETIFNKVKPGENIKNRIKVCEMISDNKLELSSGLLLGLGESYEDRANHLIFLSRFKGLGEIPVMGFNPYKGTEMENHPPCSIEEQMKAIAITRLLYKDIRITVPTPTIGPENIKFSLNAGADNLATVIPANYPMDVKGVGSPNYGNLEDVVAIVKSMGLKVEYKASK